MKNLIILSIIVFTVSSCNNSSKKVQEKVKDSIENKEIQSVETIINNEDSLMEAKKKELGIE